MRDFILSNFTIMNYVFDPEITVEITALLLSFFVFIKGIKEYRKAQKWKKLEFVSKEIKEFFNEPEIKRAMLLLDWNSNSFDVYIAKEKQEMALNFTDKDILGALMTHEERFAFTEKEVILKRIFDAFFEHLTMFENYIETGLIETKDLAPYLSYWIKILADSNNNRKSVEIKTQLWKYVDYYGYEKVRKLCYRKEFA